MADPRFPTLTQRQMRVLEEHGESITISSRERVFTQGDLEYDLFVVVSGEITIEDPTNDNKVIVVHQPGEFTGDSGMLSHRGAQFHAYAEPGASLIRIKAANLKKIIAQHSDISDTLLNAFMQRQETVLNTMEGGIRLFGSGKNDQAYQIRDFLEKNHIWYRFTDTDRDHEASALLEHWGIDDADLPILVNSNAKVCKNPNLEELARYSGVLMDFEDRVFDVLVIGAGPAGLGASVYAASEGLHVVTIDSTAPGGQAGKSSKIENYLGFPTGISGGELANRAYVQAQKFGCNISIPHRAEKLALDNGHFTLYATNGKTIKTRALIAATGADYRRLPVDHLEKYEGSGVYYSATTMHASACEGETVGIVGAGNSAGQAALFLAQYARDVHMIVRSDDLASKMSDYLVQRIRVAENITVHLATEVQELRGEHYLREIKLAGPEGEHVRPITQLFTFIGASPRTEWLSELVATDQNGFIRTGTTIAESDRAHYQKVGKRAPQSLETSIPGLFAIGDARSGSIKRVASAVGEGATAVSQVHHYLREIGEVEAVA